MAPASVFPVLAADSLGQSLRASLDWVLGRAALARPNSAAAQWLHRSGLSVPVPVLEDPRLFFSLLFRFSQELYLALDLLLQRRHLLRDGALFQENYFGLRREPVEGIGGG